MNVYEIRQNATADDISKDYHNHGNKYKLKSN